jgi:hypothetical protein
VQEFTAVFAGRAHIDEGFVRLNMIRHFLSEGTDGEIRAAGRISHGRIIGPFLRQGTPFIDPLLPPTVHDSAVLMTVHLEDPHGIASPPVVPVTIEHDGVVVTDALATHEFGERVLIDVVAHHLVLQFAMPVDFDGARDMSDVVQKHILIRLNNAHGGVVRMLCDPVGTDEYFGMYVFCHRLSLLCLRSGFQSPDEFFLAHLPQETP